MHENQKHKIQRVVAWWGWRWRKMKGFEKCYTDLRKREKIWMAMLPGNSI